MRFLVAGLYWGALVEDGGRASEARPGVRGEAPCERCRVVVACLSRAKRSRCVYLEASRDVEARQASGVPRWRCAAVDVSGCDGARVGRRGERL